MWLAAWLCAAGLSATPPLPGAAPFPGELAGRVAAAVRARGDGPGYANRLILEASPYLQQHARNPIDWYPWGSEAFAVARRLGRPVFLSIGYSSCHWCHVMERESFADAAVAEILNRGYVAVKVDREERPDVDAIYLRAIQALTGGGGWPATLWLTPDGEPFFAGTYFSRAELSKLLGELGRAWEEQPRGLLERSARIAQSVRRSLAVAPGTAVPGAPALLAAGRSYRARYDAEWGGLRGAPKFPGDLPVPLLLRLARRTGEPIYRDMARRTLESLAAGGIHDQLGGGFHRYATDAQWRVPHFEKMLYVNALLVTAYLDGYQATGDPAFARIAGETVDYLLREMTAPEGGFYAASDADERYFSWTLEELRARLAPSELELFQTRFGLTGGVLHAAGPIQDPAALALRERLYRARLERPAPARDEKVLAAWNGLAIAAVARAGFVLDRPEWIVAARRAARFVLDALRPQGRLRRSWFHGEVRGPGFLDDHAFMIAGLLELYEVTGESGWLEGALALQAELDRRFADPVGGYFATAADQDPLLAREKPAADGAEPCGNAVALMNLLRLHPLTGNAAWLTTADRLALALAAVIEADPTASPHLLAALDFRSGPVLQVWIVAARGGGEPLVDVLRRTWLPNAVRVVTAARQLGGRTSRGGRPTAFVCAGTVCRPPVVDAADLARQLAP
ncbi:MAG TPA: thioredoxin domain-containing protein [Candidatus Polarisedimenticolaceae bacterium]|nr:thioredoxin domain-containing protein [Candidatus Polarisedimenticolaceae bacterium]